MPWRTTGQPDRGVVIFDVLEAHNVPVTLEATQTSLPGRVMSDAFRRVSHLTCSPAATLVKVPECSNLMYSLTGSNAMWTRRNFATSTLAGVVLAHPRAQCLPGDPSSAATVAYVRARPDARTV